MTDLYKERKAFLPFPFSGSLSLLRTSACSPPSSVDLSGRHRHVLMMGGCLSITVMPMTTGAPSRSQAALNVF